MLKSTANSFFWCGQFLRNLRGDCLVASAGVYEGEVGFNLRHNIDERARQKGIDGMGTVEIECRKIGMTITADMVLDLIDKLKDRTGVPPSFEWLLSQIDTIERLAEKELKGKAFLYIPPERAKYWPFDGSALFGPDVAAKFPSTSFDIASAGQCLATGMSTASVFHLMRIMEIGLSVLGQVFEVSLARTNWAPAIGEIEARIRTMHTDPNWKAQPDCKELQSFYADAATHFGIIKDAWRNHTMHARAKYVEVEAERIFESTKAFMQKLSQKLAE